MIFIIYHVLVVISALCSASSPDKLLSSNKIVNGNATTIEKYPYVVHVERTARDNEAWSGWCGGSILTRRWILSAAHCFSNETYDEHRYRIRAGSTLRGVGGVIINIESRINHPTFTYIDMDGDIALAFLETSIVYTQQVQPCSIIAPGFRLPDGSSLTTIGWGRLSYGGEIPEVLQEVITYSINRALCKERYLWGGVATTVTENMICNSIFNPSGNGLLLPHGPCSGDSGGPLYYYGVVVGLVSWGWGCADLWNPSVATSISSYTEWILAVVN